MRSFRGSLLRRSRLVLVCSALAAVLAISPDAEARTQKHRKRQMFVAPLQPFVFARTVVHAVAGPIVHNAPRILAAAAVAPIRVAYHLPRTTPPRPPRAEEFDETDEEPVMRPIRVAYQVPGRTPAMAPRADFEEDYEQEEEQDYESEAEPAIERRGDRPTVAGSRAVLRNGIAYAPSRAPQSVKNAIWAANTLRRKPYVWGGGHGSFNDYGYDCSGSVSFALRGAGLLSAPIPSSDFLRYGERGRGRWITIYSRPGHTFAVIAGLRFDTTDMRHGGNVGPRWHTDGRDLRGFQARHPAGF